MTENNNFSISILNTPLVQPEKTLPNDKLMEVTNQVSKKGFRKLEEGNTTMCCQHNFKPFLLKTERKNLEIL